MNYDPQGVPRELDYVEIAQTVDADQTAAILGETFRNLVGAQNVLIRNQAILPKRLAAGADTTTYNNALTSLLTNLGDAVNDLKDMLAVVIAPE